RGPGGAQRHPPNERPRPHHLEREPRVGHETGLDPHLRPQEGHVRATRSELVPHRQTRIDVSGRPPAGDHHSHGPITASVSSTGAVDRRPARVRSTPARPPRPKTRSTRTLRTKRTEAEPP